MFLIKNTLKMFICLYVTQALVCLKQVAVVCKVLLIPKIAVIDWYYHG
jgi:hypothetical protein